MLLVSHKSKVWGIQRRLLVLGPALAQRGVRMTLAAPPTGRWAEMWRATGLDFLPIELPAHGGLRQHGSAKRASARQLMREGAVVLESARRIATIARGHDLLFSGSLTAHTEVALAARLARRPSVLMLVDIVAPGIGRKLLRVAASLATATVVNSTATMSTLGRASGVHLIHPGIDLDAFQPGTPAPEVRSSLGGRAGELLVGIVGRIDEEKGIHDLVDAIRALRDRGVPVRLAIVGGVGTGPDEYGERVRMHAESALADAVCFAGRRDDIAAVMRSLDVLVNASIAEPFGMSVLEAHACGTPVVATAAGGVVDFVEDGVNGLLVPPRDVVRLSEALQTLALDGELRRQLGAAGRRSAERGFDVRDQVPRYESLFRDVAGPRKRDESTQLRM